MKMPTRFLECGILEYGFARVLSFQHIHDAKLELATLM
jgi:hypothetical protein